jgi:NADH:ubiquinone oxidoreductase subunit E
MTDLSPAKTILSNRKSVSADDLIPILQEIQEAYGYLPADVLHWVSERTGIPASRMYGVITFYAQFYLQPHGKHTVRCCRGTACHVRGGKKIINVVRGQLGIEDGATTADMLFSFETVACLGACALSPVMVVDNTYHGKMTPRMAEQILQQLGQGARS